MKDATKARVHRDALSLLTRRDYCYHEILQKLQQKGHDVSEIKDVLENLIQCGLLSDERFVENYIHARRAKGFGPKRINLELKARGIEDDVIAALLDITDNIWLDKASIIWRKRFKGKKPNSFVERMRQMNYLQYRGFTQEQIDSVMVGDSDERF